MREVFNGIKTGAEIWEIIKNPLLNESNWEKDRDYKFVQYDRVGNFGVISTESNLIPTEDERIIYEKETRKSEISSRVGVINKEMEDYYFDTAKVEKLELEKQALIDEYTELNAVE